MPGLLWTGDQYQELLPVTLYPEEPCALMDEVLAVYARHRKLLRRTHRPGEDWFELARRQGRARQLVPQQAVSCGPAISGDVLGCSS